MVVIPASGIAARLGRRFGVGPFITGLTHVTTGSDRESAQRDVNPYGMAVVNEDWAGWSPATCL